MCKLVGVVERACNGKCQRTWVRFPGPPYLFNIILVCLIKSTGFSYDHHTPSIFSQSNHQQTRSKDHPLEVHHTPSQVSNTGSGKSTWARRFWAQKLQFRPPFFGYNTRPILISFLFLSFI